VLELSAWFDALSEKDRDQVRRIADESAEIVFYTLLVLVDRLTALVEAPEGVLSVRLVSPTETVDLAVPEGEPDAHNLYRDVVGRVLDQGKRQH